MKMSYGVRLTAILTPFEIDDMVGIAYTIDPLYESEVRDYLGKLFSICSARDTKRHQIIAKRWAFS